MFDHKVHCSLAKQREGFDGNKGQHEPMDVLDVLLR